MRAAPATVLPTFAHLPVPVIMAAPKAVGLLQVCGTGPDCVVHPANMACCVWLALLLSCCSAAGVWLPVFVTCPPPSIVPVCLAPVDMGALPI